MPPSGRGLGEQLLAQGLGDRLPDRLRRELGEMVGDAVDERVRGAPERLDVGIVAVRVPGCSQRKHRFRVGHAAASISERRRSKAQADTGPYAFG